MTSPSDQSGAGQLSRPRRRTHFGGAHQDSRQQTTSRYSATARTHGGSSENSPTHAPSSLARTAAHTERRSCDGHPPTPTPRGRRNAPHRVSRAPPVSNMLPLLSNPPTG